MIECDFCGAEYPTERRSLYWAEKRKTVDLCSSECSVGWRQMAQLVRGVAALESIATFMEKIANPVIKVPKPLPPGMVKCQYCPAVVPEQLMEQHHREVHRPPELKRPQPPEETPDGHEKCMFCPAVLPKEKLSDHYREVHTDRGPIHTGEKS